MHAFPPSLTVPCTASTKATNWSANGWTAARRSGHPPTPSGDRRCVLCCICMTACMQATFAQRNAMQRGHGWAGLPRVRMNARCLWCVLCVPKSKCRDARVTDGTSRPSQPASGSDPFDCDDIYSNLFFKNKRI
jgi:hypothetical protein